MKVQCFSFAWGWWLCAFFWSSALLLFLEVGVDQGADELSASALHAGNDGSDVISSSLIKVGRDAAVLLWRPCVQG